MSDIDVRSRIAEVAAARQRADYDSIRRMLRSHATLDPTVTRVALRVLRKDGVGDSADDVCDVLEHGRPELRVAAARTLAVVTSLAEPSSRTRAVEALGRLYHASDEWSERAWALAALGDIGDPRAVALLNAAARDSHPRVALSAALALGKIGDPSGISGVRDYLAASHPLNPYGQLRLFFVSRKLSKAAQAHDVRGQD